MDPKYLLLIFNFEIAFVLEVLAPTYVSFLGNNQYFLHF